MKKMLVSVKTTRRKNEAEKRLEILRNAGVDISKYLSINDNIVKVVNGEFVEVDIENILNSISEKGDVFNSKLDGRWIMGQMLKMLGTEDYNATLNLKGYMYQWDFLANKYIIKGNIKRDGELYRLAKRERDGEDLSTKEMFFNKQLICNMIDDYIHKLNKFAINNYSFKDGGYLLEKNLTNIRIAKLVGVNEIEKRNCANIRCFSITQEEFDLIKSIYEQVKKLINNHATTYEDLYLNVITFKSIMIELPKETLMSNDFKDAYKQNGVYYTVNNMIRYHGFRIDNRDKNGSLEILNQRIYNHVGYQNLGWLKDLIKDTKFDLGKRVKEMNTNRYSF